MLLSPQRPAQAATLHVRDGQRITAEQVRRAVKSAEEESKYFRDRQVALRMALVPHRGCPARLPEGWPMEAWICYGDQKLALLVAFQVHIARRQNIWWPQLANLIFPDRREGSAQLRWNAAHNAAKILANALRANCKETTSCLDTYTPPFLIVYHLLIEMHCQKPLQAYYDACLLSGLDPTCMPWAHQTEAAIDAIFPAFRTGLIYHFFFRETDGGAEYAKWETMHGDMRLSAYLLEKNWPFRRPQMAVGQKVYKFGQNFAAAAPLLGHGAENDDDQSRAHRSGFTDSSDDSPSSSGTATSSSDGDPKHAHAEGMTTG
ncbi:hypothetical protein COCOBI_17-2940 [Coccomyxa sp. Obi]|nr:hypothetical protein COCOBI_17-2940 [Coccomyxa sp. Obi]